MLHVLSGHLQPKQVGKINHFTYFHLYIPSSIPFLCVVSVNMYRYRGTKISLVHACESKRLTLGLLQLDSTFIHSDRVSPLNPELTEFASIGKQTSEGDRNSLCIPPEYWDYRQASILVLSLLSTF